LLVPRHVTLGMFFLRPPTKTQLILIKMVNAVVEFC